MRHGLWHAILQLYKINPLRVVDVKCTTLVSDCKIKRMQTLIQLVETQCLRLFPTGLAFSRSQILCKMEHFRKKGCLGNSYMVDMPSETIAREVVVCVVQGTFRNSALSLYQLVRIADLDSLTDQLQDNGDRWHSLCVSLVSVVANKKNFPNGQGSSNLAGPPKKLHSPCLEDIQTCQQSRDGRTRMCFQALATTNSSRCSWLEPCKWMKEGA